MTDKFNIAVELLCEAEKIIQHGVSLMTDEQIGQWAGVRGWLELWETLLEENPNDTMGKNMRITQ